MSIQVIDNFLSQEEFSVLKEQMINLPWYYADGKVLKYDERYNNIYNFQLYHKFYFIKKDVGPIASDYINYLYPITDRLDFVKPLRIKANLTFSTPTILIYGMHTDRNTDVAEDYQTALYYVNTNNGYTIFENGDKVESIENRICIFNGRMLHSGTSCTDQKYRCVINFNWIKE